jgi:hypothetical protein
MELEEQIWNMYRLSLPSKDKNLGPVNSWEENDARTDYALAIAESAVSTTTFFRQEAMRRIMQLIKDNFVYVATSHLRYFKEWTKLLAKEVEEQ